MSKSAPGEDVAGSILVAVVLLTLVVVVVVVAALSAGAKEIGMIYGEHAHPGSPHRGVLLGVLAALGGIALVLCLVAVAIPGTTVACVVTFAWALLAFVATVEGIDLIGRRQLKDGGNVASYLDFSPNAGKRERVALP